jgi:hypothetical protein
MAKKVPMTPAQAKLEAKIFGLLQKKRYADARAVVKDLTRNSTGRKILRGVFGSALWLTRSKALWAIALGAAAFKYGPELLDKFTDPDITEDQMDEYISDLGENIPDRNFVTEIPRGGGALDARILSERQMERAGEKLQREVTEGEQAQAEGLLFSPEVREARSLERQMLPSGTFDRGWQQQRFRPSGSLLTTTTTPGLEEGLRRNRLYPAIGDKYTGGQYTPSGNIGLVEERRFQPDRRIGPRPQPVETPWDQAGRQAEVYGPDNRQAALASLRAQEQLGEQVTGGQRITGLQEQQIALAEEERALAEMHRSQSPQQYPMPVPSTIPPTVPDMETGPEIEYPREVKRYESMPTTEEAEAGAFDFEDLIQDVTTEEQLVAAAEGLDKQPLTGEERLTAGATTLYNVGKAVGDVAGASVKVVGNLIDAVTSGGDVTNEETKLATDIVLDAQGNILSTGEVAPEGDVSTTSASAKEGLKEQGKREVVQTNVDATVNKYNLSPNIGQTLSQIEKNAGILRAASVMMGVKDISSNYRDMSIGQLRLARDIVEDLNGGQGPWKTWWSPDGSEQRNLPIKGAASQPPEGWQDTNPTARLTPTAQLVTNVKGLIETEGPWSAYNAALSYKIAEGWSQKEKDTHAANLITMWMKENNPDLPYNFQWPTRPAYEAWASGGTSDEDFKGLFGFNFQR